MKKLLLLLLAFAFPVYTMHKRKHEKIQAPKISFTKTFYSKDLGSYVIEAKKEDRAAPIGQIRFDHAPEDKEIGHIYEIDVHPNFRKQKIGYQLFRAAIVELQRQDYSKVSWDALGADELSTQELEEVYIAMVRNIAQEIECDLLIGVRRTSEIFDLTPFLLTFKNKRYNNEFTRPA